MKSPSRKGSRTRVLRSLSRKLSAKGRGLSWFKVAAPGAQSSLPASTAQLEERWPMGSVGQWLL